MPASASSAGMNMPEARTDVIDRARITPKVRHALGSPTAEVVSWQAFRPEGWSAGENTIGLYRIKGLADLDSRQVPWSMVVKILASPASRLQGLDTASTGCFAEDPQDVAYWRREALVYESGLLVDLPGGLGFPRCLAVEHPNEGEAWLWLEDVEDELPGTWPLERYACVARELGRFNGAYLAQRPLPREPWLVRGCLRSWVAKRTPHLALIAVPEIWEHPSIRAFFPPSTRQRILALWERRDTLFDALDRLSTTFCHLDAHPANLLTRTRRGGTQETVVLDWSCPGLAPPGAEAQVLVAGALATLRAEPEAAAAMDAAVSAGYLDGLRDCGLKPEPQALRFAYAASASLQWTFGMAGLLLRSALDESMRVRTEILHRRSFQEFVAHRAGMILYLLDLADGV